MEYTKPMFTEKHFYKTAQVFGDVFYMLWLEPSKTNEEASEKLQKARGINDVIDMYIKVFKEDNPKFDVNKFQNQIEKVRKGDD